MLRLFSVLVLLLLPAGPASAGGQSGAEAITRALAVVCGDWKLPPREMARRMGATFVKEELGKFQQLVVRLTRTFELEDGGRLRINMVVPGGRLRRVGVVYHQPRAGGEPRPSLMALAQPQAGKTCRMRDIRRLVYGAEGKPVELVFLGPDFKDTGRREPLDAPLPAGADPGGVTVALIDSGINYTLPKLAARLARDQNGKPLGYDFWDMDDRPFDSNTALSPFIPLRHGTRVASVLVAEAPGARLIPYRYPRPDMGRMKDLIADADAKGAIIVAMPMGSNKRQDWTAFEAAARARPHMLFIVSAGNNNRHIELGPVYPAAFELENMLVVTSAETDGRLGGGANWSENRVHLMVPAEKIETTDHLGRPTRFSGSSAAVARVAALAARLLAANPGWKAGRLKAAIIARAEPLPNPKAKPTRYGWIPNPEKDR